MGEEPRPVVVLAEGHGNIQCIAELVLNTDYDPVIRNRKDSCLLLRLLRNIILTDLIRFFSVVTML